MQVCVFGFFSQKNSEKFKFFEGTEDLNAPTPDELKSSIGGDDVRRRLRFDGDAAGA